MKRGLGFSAGMLAALVSIETTSAVPVAVAPDVVVMVFDTGGALDNPVGTNTLGGLEVTAAGTVFVTGADGFTGGPITTLQLLSSTGLGTAATVGAAVTTSLNARGYDLTRNPADGKLYFVGNLAGSPSITGLDPAGVAAPTSFAALSSTPATSGLVFNPGGTIALVATDGVGPPGPTLPNGLYSVPAGGPEALVVGLGALPGGIPAGTDDVVVTLDGRTLIIGDGSHDIWDATGGAGSVSLLIDLDAFPALAGHLGGGGVRAAVDPNSGDVYVGWGLSGGSIVRFTADGSSASVVATGFSQLRDLDFGLASNGSGNFSLYVSETTPGGIGTIYELSISVIPEPTTAMLCLLASAGLLRRRRAA